VATLNNKMKTNLYEDDPQQDIVLRVRNPYLPLTAQGKIQDPTAVESKLVPTDETEPVYEEPKPAEEEHQAPLSVDSSSPPTA
jgi:hypothetical protein